MIAFVHRALLLAAFTCGAFGSLAAPRALGHDFFTGNGSSPDGPEDPDNQDGCPCGEEGADPIMLFDGDFREDRVDVRLTGRLDDFELRFRYRSRSGYNGPYGYGWDHSYNRKMKRLANGDVVRLTGGVWSERFTYVPQTQTFVNPMHFYGSLADNANGTLTLTHSDGRKEEYDIDGNLSATVDRAGNAVSFAHSAMKMPVVGPSDYFVDQAQGIVAYEHLLLQVSDTVGRSITFDYDGTNHLSSITYAGRTVSYQYDAAGNLTSVVRPATAAFPSGTVTTYAYDASHNLTSIVDENGATYLTNTYDAEDRVATQVFGNGAYGLAYGNDGSNDFTDMTDPLGFLTRYTFDADGHLIQEEQFNDGVPAGEPTSYVTSYEYDANGELIRHRFPNGNAVEYSYSSKGLLTELRRKKPGLPPFVPDPSDLVTTIVYEPLFDLTKTVTDPSGNTVTYAYDYELGEAAKGRLRKVTFPMISGQAVETEITYNAFGQVETVTDPNGNVLRRTYDSGHGQLAELRSAFGTPDEAVFQYSYDAVGNLATLVEPNRMTTSFQYDAQDRLDRVVDPLGHAIHYRYDANGNVRQVDRQATGGSPGGLPPLGTTSAGDDWQSSVYTYGVLDRLVAVIDDLGHAATYTYDAAGNQASAADAGGNVTTFEYGESNRLIRITEPGAPGAATEFTYDGNGNTTSMRDGNGNLSTWMIDGYDRPVKLTYADGSFENYVFDANGNLTAWTTGAGVPVSYSYDALNRLRTRVTPSSTDSFGYDAGSRLVSATNSIAAAAFTYDHQDRIVAATTTLPGLPPFHTGYRYDALGNRTRVEYPDGFGLDYAYDGLNRLRSIVAPAPGAGPKASYDFAYDPLSQRERLTRRNGLVTRYRHDRASRLIDMRHALGPVEVAKSAYTYDGRANRVAVDDDYGHHAFTYGPIDELLSADHPATFPFPDTTFTYDAMGNRLQTLSTNGTTAYVPNVLNQYQSVGATNPTYDGAGNLTSDGTRSYSYDALNRLVGAAGPFGTATYLYDALDRRLAKIVNGVATIFLYDGVDVILEANGAGVFQNRYITALGVDEPLALDRGGQRYDYLSDALGSTLALADASGQVVERYAYDVFGSPAVFDGQGTPIAQSAFGNRFLFTGREFDAETGNYHLRNRDYHPSLGRFMQRDPLGFVPGLNLYRYVSNNPLGYVDPFGLAKEPSFWDKEPGFFESMIPVWGSARSAIADFRKGNILGGIFNTVLAVTDLVPAKAVWGAASKGLLWKTGSHTWGATKSWLRKNGYTAFKGQPVHHWLIPQNQWGKNVPNWLKNQPWNLMPIPGKNPQAAKRFHDAIEGKGIDAYGLFGRLWHGSPTWAKAVAASYTGKVGNNLANDGDGSAGCN